jgi:hypothetical protein
MNRRCLIAAVALLGVSVPAMADPIVISAHSASFRGFELAWSGQERIDRATLYLQAAIPQGSALADARTLLTRAGARCTGHDDARMTCVSNAFEAVEDMGHDVSWTILIDHAGNTVTGLSLARDSIGS